MIYHCSRLFNRALSSGENLTFWAARKRSREASLVSLTDKESANKENLAKGKLAKGKLAKSGLSCNSDITGHISESVKLNCDSDMAAYLDIAAYSESVKLRKRDGGWRG